MANQEQSSADGDKATPAADVAAGGITAKGAQRRRFAKAGAGASAGVLLTLASQPAMATVCTSPSGTLSGNNSRNQARCTGGGYRPEYWYANHSSWRYAGTNGDANFSQTFYCGGRGAALVKYTCFQTVDANKVPITDDPSRVGMYFMATLLNVRCGRITFLTEAQVLAAWYSYAQNGYYKPNSTTTWYARDIVNYLSSTMM